MGAQLGEELGVADLSGQRTACTGVQPNDASATATRQALVGAQHDQLLDVLLVQPEPDFHCGGGRQANGLSTVPNGSTRGAQCGGDRTGGVHTLSLQCKLVARGNLDAGALRLLLQGAPLLLQLHHAALRVPKRLHRADGAGGGRAWRVVARWEGAGARRRASALLHMGTGALALAYTARTARVTCTARAALGAPVPAARGSHAQGHAPTCTRSSPSCARTCSWQCGGGPAQEWLLGAAAPRTAGCERAASAWPAYRACTLRQRSGGASGCQSMPELPALRLLTHSCSTYSPMLRPMSSAKAALNSNWHSRLWPALACSQPMKKRSGFGCEYRVP